jgi:hypothetical protein
MGCCGHQMQLFAATPLLRRPSCLLNCRASAPKPLRMAARGRRVVLVECSATAVKTVKIGTRGSPLALAQAYLTRDLLKVRDQVWYLAKSCSQLLILAACNDYRLAFPSCARTGH